MDLLKLDKRLANISKNTPNKIAVECGQEKTTYLELEENSNRIANFLMNFYSENKNVFVMMDSNTRLIEATIGIIKSSGIFVPINYNWPDDRIKLFLNTVNGEWIITTNKLLHRVNNIAGMLGLSFNVLVLDCENKSENANYQNLRTYLIHDYTETTEKTYEYCKNEHCYIFFTSGSTGKPKAILGRYKSLMQFMDWEINEFNINESFKISQLTPFTVDAFMRDMLVPLLVGGTLCIPGSRGIILNPIKLIKWIEESKINLMHVVPSLFKMMDGELENSEQLKELKYILLSGELLRGKYIKNFIYLFGNRIQLVNLYGPTETTLIKFFYRIKPSDAEKNIIPVGIPISQCQGYILNNNLKKCPVGVVGEIYIRSPYISSGYVNDTELTEKVFQRNPFTNNENDIIYKTGDMGRKLSDGNIEVIGRADSQVKVRGMRIELGEIESKLLEYELVKEAVVIAKEDENCNTYLCAYVIGNIEITVTELRNYLSKTLPDYMVPSYFILLNSMPLNNTGKIDRQSLARIECTNECGSECIEATNETEHQLLKLFSNILNVKNLGITSNFFDMGGHSLKAAKLISQIYKSFNIEVPLLEIYNNPTVKELSLFIQNIDINGNIKLKLLNDKLRHEFGERCRLIKYKSELSEEFILYTDEFSEEMLNYIGNNSNNMILVDYVCDYDTLVDNSGTQEISLKELSSKLKLITVSEDDFKSIFDKQKLMMEKFRQDILHKQKINKYNIGCVMNSNCKRTHHQNTRQMMKFTILFRNKNLNSNLSNILTKLINDQSVLRTSICLEDKTYRFEEHDKIIQTNFNIIDLSIYDYKSKIKIIKKILDFSDNTLNNESYLDNILYYFSIVKLSLNQYCFILNIDHQISDIHTPRIIKKYFEEQFDDAFEVLPFNHYIQNLLLADREKKFNIFNNSIILKEHKDASEVFYKYYPEYTKGKPIVISKPFVLSYWLDNDINKSNVENRTILETTMYIIVKALSFQFKLDNLPLAIVTNKRILGKYNYYYTIGNFVDRLPCTFKSNCDRISDYYNKYIDIQNELSRNNIILRELNGDLKFTEYVYKLSPFSLNFYGDFTKIEDMDQMERIGVISTLSYNIKAYSVNSSVLKILFGNGINDETVLYMKRLMDDLGGKYDCKFH